MKNRTKYNVSLDLAMDGSSTSNWLSVTFVSFQMGHFLLMKSTIQFMKILMPCPSFGRVQIVLIGSKSFWSGPKDFGQVQKILVRFKLDCSGLTFLILTCLKWFWPNQNKSDPSKTMGTRPKWFGRSKIILDP